MNNISNREKFSWNLAYNLVMQVKDDYTILTKVHPECEKEKELKAMVEHLDSPYYNSIFSFLDVTQKDCCVLLKYKNYQYIFNDEINNDNFWEMYGGLFNYCRSTVINIAEESIVLATLNKFHNINERKGYMFKEIQNLISEAKKVEVSDKLDGSNQNFRWYHNEIFGAGSQSLDVKQSWRLANGYALITKQYKDMMRNFPDYTFLYEYISQEDCHVVCYTKEQEGLYLFGMRNVNTGKELTYEQVLSIGKQYGVRTTEVFNETLDNIISKLDDYTSDEKEGWVIGIQDEKNNTFRVKIKINDYVKMHGLLNKLVSPNMVIRSIADDNFDDFMAKIPVGHRKKMNNYAKIVYSYASTMNEEVNNYFESSPKNDKKEFMIWAEENIPKKYRGYVRSKYLNKDYNFLRTGSLKIPSYKSFNEILKEENISIEEVFEE